MLEILSLSQRIFIFSNVEIPVHLLQYLLIILLLLLADRLLVLLGLNELSLSPSLSFCLASSYLCSYALLWTVSFILWFSDECDELVSYSYHFTFYYRFPKLLQYDAEGSYFLWLFEISLIICFLLRVDNFGP